MEMARLKEAIPENGHVTTIWKNLIKEPMPKVVKTAIVFLPSLVGWEILREMARATAERMAHDQLTGRMGDVIGGEQAYRWRNQSPPVTLAIHPEVLEDNDLAVRAAEYSTSKWGQAELINPTHCIIPARRAHHTIECAAVKMQAVSPITAQVIFPQAGRADLELPIAKNYQRFYATSADDGKPRVVTDPLFCQGLVPPEHIANFMFRFQGKRKQTWQKAIVAGHLASVEGAVPGWQHNDSAQAARRAMGMTDENDNLRLPPPLTDLGDNKKAEYRPYLIPWKGAMSAIGRHLPALLAIEETGVAAWHTEVDYDADDIPVPLTLAQRKIVSLAQAGKLPKRESNKVATHEQFKLREEDKREHAESQAQSDKPQQGYSQEETAQRASAKKEKSHSSGMWSRRNRTWTLNFSTIRAREPTRYKRRAAAGAPGRKIRETQMNSGKNVVITQKKQMRHGGRKRHPKVRSKNRRCSVPQTKEGGPGREPELEAKTINGREVGPESAGCDLEGP